ncbi:hypothetical protein PIROE2DRAFT_57781 [Piromyces sp. E2]|nr:hypothetical protein PIROE2DRAFT_57781 [Piromyces sp. E2]|eukprot:OUM68929.1 hypothetical protein PIROE2DRAFT_57781 [Piromyces sp. E2]
MISYKWISLTVGLLFIPQLIRSESALTACTNASNCGLTSDSYCVASGQYLKQVSGGTCATVESLTKDDYLIFKKPSTGNIYTKEDQITATDTYVVYQAGDQGTKGMVSQIKSMTMLVGDKLLVCGEGGECKAESELGLYFAESELKPVTCGEEGCAVEEVPGVFYLNEKVYQCKVSGTSITCDEVEFKDLSPEERRKREDAAEEAKLSKDESGNIIITKGDSTEIVIEITDEETKYAVFDEDLSKGLIDDQNATFIKRTKTYAIRVQPEVGYYLNGGSEVDGITNALLYCSTKSDVSKCAAVETVAEGYYAIAGVTGEESIYLQCEEEAVAEGGGDARKREDGGGSEAKANACKEVKEKEFNTCGSSKDIPTCDQIKNPEAVCREGAVEGEVCFLEGRFYESGKDTCQEMKDQDRRSSFIYFNDRHKRVLPQSPLTPDPVIYQCTVVELTSLDNCKLSGNQVTETAKCQKGDNTTLDYCKKGSVVYRTVGETCVVAEEGELYDCKKNEHTLPTCPKKQNNSADCMDEGYCIHTDNKLYVKTNGVCGAVNLGASDVDAIWYFDKQFNRIKYDDIKSNTVIYTRYKFKNYESDTWEKVEAAGVGEMIRVYPHSIEMCLGPEETIPLLATEQSYHEISGAFAGLESATYNIKSIGNGIIKITTGTEAALPECASEESGGGVGNRKREEPEAEAIQCTEGGGYCRDSTTGYIAVKSGQKCALITHTEASTTAVKYFDKDEKIPTAIEPDTITKAYTCEFNEAKEGDGCLLLKGYFTNDDASKVITCNGVEGDTCVVTEISTCTGNGDGGIGKDGSGNVSLCIGSEALPLPETAGFYAYKATNDNFIYGVKKGEFVLLRVGANYAAVVETYKTAAEQIYYINSLHPDISKNVNSEPLVKCSFAAAVDAEERRKRADQPPEEEEVEEVFKNNDGCIGIPAGGTSYDEPVKYYLDYTDPKNIVKCTFSGKCEKVVVMTDEFTTGTKYFVNGEGTAGTIIECDSAAESGECSINSKVEADSIFIDGDNDKAIITCIDNSVPDEDDADNARRKREDGDQAAGGSVLCSSEEIIGVKSNGKTEINAVIIQCTGSKACEEVTTATSTAITYEDGVFSFNDGTASRRRKRDEAPAADEGAVESGYDILSDSDANGLLGINQKSLVLFTSKVVTKVAVNAGYYPRPMTGLENAMIKCTGTSDSTCEIVEKVTPGYYVFGGDGQSYIECTENCVITPVVYTSCENEEELPSCGSDEGTGEQRKRDDEEGPTCITNAPINSVCINDGALFKVVAGEAGCKSFGEEAGKTYHFDENYMELTGDYDPSLVKYTYTCSIETNDRRKREGESVSCIVSKQKIGGIIKTSGTVITPSKTLPNCDGAATSATEICKTSVFDGTDDNINGVHCIDNTGVIYKNSVKNSGTEKSCAVAVGTESETEYLAFDVDGRRIDEVTGESANLVASTYLCTVDGDKAVSGCVLNGNQLPRCDVGGTEEEAAEGGEARRKREEEADAPEVPVEINSRCYANAPVNSVCVTTDGKLMVTESANSCVGLVGLKETIHNFGSDFNEITDPAKSNSIKYSYFCESGGDAETGLSALDKCTPVHPSKGGVGLADVSPILKFCRSAEDSESLPMVATSNQYLSVTLSNAEDFPGAADTGIEVKIGMDGSITELPVENKEAIPKCDAEESENRKREEKDNSCKSGESTVNYCVDASGIINETVDKACQKIKGAKGQKLLSYYKIGEEDALEKVTNVSDETTDIAYAYECEFEAGEANDTETDAKTCEQIKGYKVMDSTSAIYCNGKKDKACVVHDLSTCQAGNVGVLGKSGSNVAVCFGTTGEKLPGEDKTKTIAFYTSEYSDMYGKYGVILLELTATTVKSTETSVKDLLPACKVDGPITDDVCSKEECPSGVVGESPCYTGAAANTVCINSNNVLLQTSGGKCVAVTGTANSLLYFDANGVKKDIGKSNDVAGIAYTYRCKKAGSGGAVSQCTQEYQKAGGIVVMGSAAGDIKMCASEDDNDAVKLSDTSSLYKIVGVKSFPGITTDSTVKVKRTDKASIFEVKELASLPTCSNNKETNDPCVAGSVKVNYCINGNVIYATQEGKCLKESSTAAYGNLPVCTEGVGVKKCIAGATDGTHCTRGGLLYETVTPASANGNKRCVFSITCQSTVSPFGIYFAGTAAVENEKIIRCGSGACVSGASDGAVCLKGGKLYITYNSKCISVSDLSACTNTTGDAVCVENAQDNDLCRIGDEIYRSGSSTCSKVTSVIDRSTTSLTFYFSTDKKKIESMANGNSESIASVYKCTHKNGNLYGCGKSVRQAGELIYTQTANRAGRLFEVCMGDGDHQGISPVGYRTIPISKVNAFPGASQPGSTAVHFGKNHVRLIRERTLLPECDVSSGSRGCRAYGLEVSHCMMEDMLYETHGTACNKLVGQATALTYLFFDGNGVIRRESEIDLRTDIAFIYQCSLSPNDNSCKPLRGFLKESTDCPSDEKTLNEFRLVNDTEPGIYALNCVDGEEKDNLCSLKSFISLEENKIIVSKIKIKKKITGKERNKLGGEGLFPYKKKNT